MDKQKLEDSIKLLKNIVNNSHIKNQKFIDLNLVSATEKPKYQEALLYTRTLIEHGELTQEELKVRLGL